MCRARAREPVKRSASGVGDSQYEDSLLVPLERDYVRKALENRSPDHWRGAA
jgi:hypothetical protein